MNLNFWLIQTFNGISYGALLFLVGSGLSLIFGVMRIVKLVDYVHVMSKGQVVYSSRPEELWANDEIKHSYLGI